MSVEQKVGYAPGGDVSRGVDTFTVSDTTVRNVYVSLFGARRWSVQQVTTGTITSTTKVYVSNSYIPHPVLGAAAPIRVGTWTEVTSLCDGITNPAGSAGNCFITPKTTTRFADGGTIKVEFTPASGTGTATFYSKAAS